MQRHIAVTCLLLLAFAGTASAAASDALSHTFFSDMMVLRDSTSARVSSYDRSGGNGDSRAILPGQTFELAGIPGAGCIRHVYFTVLGTEHYRLGREAELSPVDLALGWGPMADDAVLDRIDIRQSGRFFYWRTERFPIPRRDIETHSANMHMIPANAEIDRQLRAVRTGDIVRFRGYLVRIEAADGWQWRSSLTRDDTGNGACELVLLESLNSQ